ncbi:MAG: LamG-like jellyroll fold domain-containing protein [Planctomycetota bacterium]|jgi:hypothetical protein
MYGKPAETILFGLALAFISAGAAEAVSLNDPDLIGYWSFNEGSGTVAADLSSNGYDGTLNGGATWTGGIYGSALQFNGSDSYVATGQSFLNDLAGFTLAGWVSGSNTGSYAGLFGQNDLIEFGFTSENGGQLGVWMSGNAWQFIGADYNFPYPSWHHVALTGDASRVVIYIDGQEAASDEGGMVSGNSGFPFNIGAYVFNENPDPLLGEIDDVWVVGRALDKEEIQILMGGAAAYPYASGPSPADGAVHPQTWVTLGWRAGDFAVSHDVYLGTSYDDVNDGAGDTFQGNKTDLMLIAGFAGFPFPDGLVPGTTYYWRVDEINDAEPNSPWKGDVWSFWVPPKEAYAPSPGDGSMFVDTSAALTWTPGFKAGLHQVYFGDNLADVEAGTGGTYKGPVTSASYDPGTLELDKTYYWRVDTTGGDFGQVTGNVWSFRTTIAGLGTVVYERWDGIETTELDTLKYSFRYPDNPDVTELLTEFSIIPGLDQYGGRIHGWVYVPGTGDYTFWLCSDNEGELWLSTDDDPANVKLIAQETDWVPANTWRTGEEQSDAIPLVAGEKYYIMALWKEGDGGDQCQVAWQGPGVPTTTIIGGANLSPFEPMAAYGARPAKGATGVTQSPVLTWKAGLEAASHELYFGTDEAAVAGADKSSPEYIGARALGDESYSPGKLPWDATYYWRVDEVNNANAESPWAGKVWSFTAADFLIVDDFESYNNIEPPDAASNRIFDKWIDGFGNTTNGALVGNDFPPYAETSVVHSGSQAMVYRYDNNLKTSEATLTLVYPRDWTEGGVSKLSLWFIGDPVNAAERMFVALNGAAVVYHDDASATQIDAWTEWVVDLSAFGVDLANVSGITIGFGTRGSPAAGGAGTMRFDDIRLVK